MSRAIDGRMCGTEAESSPPEVVQRTQGRGVFPVELLQAGMVGPGRDAGIAKRRSPQASGRAINMQARNELSL